MGHRLVASAPPAERLFDAVEADLVARGLAALAATSPHDAEVLSAQVDRLSLLSEALARAPSLRERSTLGRATRDLDSLVDRLVHFDLLGGELALPEKAVMGRAFLTLKIALLRGFRVALARGAPGADAALDIEFSVELAQSISTAIATEILATLLGDVLVAERTRARAAEQLVLVWEHAALVEIDDFCPMLEAAWRARSCVAAGLGALLGTAEYMRLVQADCPEQFLAYFAREGTSPAECQAFEEFLFGMPYEELEKLRAVMQLDGRSVIDAAYAERVLGRPVDEGALTDHPEALYRSYRRRLFAAERRRQGSMPGPPHVAESYLMIHLLEQGAGPVVR